MSASTKIGGYQCEFMEAVSEDFVCGLCKHVARSPTSLAVARKRFVSCASPPLSRTGSHVPPVRKLNFQPCSMSSTSDGFYSLRFVAR